MKRLKTLVVALACTLTFANCLPPPCSNCFEEVKAVSLNGLQQALKACQPTNTCTPDMLQLGGIRRLAGVIVDRDNRDLILYGRYDSDLPPLNLDDFVVALRNAWLKYAVLKGDVIEYSTPGCSIDPDPENVSNLQAIGRQMEDAKSFDGKDKHIEAWKRECEKPQKVRVLGIPFNTHFAQVMIKADYDLKVLTDGSEAVNVPGFVSLSDSTLDEVTSAFLQHQTIQAPTFSLNRFWFYPGENVFESDEDSFFLKQSPVTLLTELMYARASGELTGTDTVEPHADRFATDFTLLYGKIAYEKTVYRELEALFRFVSVAGVIKQVAGDNAAFDLSYLLDSYRIQEIPVDQSLAGRHAVKEFYQRRAEPGGYNEVRFWLPSCGGVNIDIRRKTNRDKVGLITKLKNSIVAAKPAQDSFHWSYLDKNEILSDLELNARLSDSNQVNKHHLVIGIAYKPDGYVVYDGQTDRLYEGDNLIELVKTVKAKASADNKLVQAFLKDFPDQKRVDLFLNTYDIQSQRFNIFNNKPSARTPDFIQQQELLLSPGVRFDEKGSYVESITEGEYKGMHRSVLSFFSTVGRTIQKFVIHVVANTQAAAESFLAAFAARVGRNRSSTTTLADIIEETHRELEERYPEHRIYKIYLHEFGAKPQSKLTTAGDQSHS